MSFTEKSLKSPLLKCATELMTAVLLPALWSSRSEPSRPDRLKYECLSPGGELTLPPHTNSRVQPYLGQYGGIANIQHVIVIKTSGQPKLRLASALGGLQQTRQTPQHTPCGQPSYQQGLRPEVPRHQSQMRPFDLERRGSCHAMVVLSEHFLHKGDLPCQG